MDPNPFQPPFPNSFTPQNSPAPFIPIQPSIFQPSPPYQAPSTFQPPPPSYQPPSTFQPPPPSFQAPSPFQSSPPSFQATSSFQAPSHPTFQPPSSAQPPSTSFHGISIPSLNQESVPNHFPSPYSQSYEDSQDEYANEPPLLDELGIDFDLISRKTISVLNPLKKTVDGDLLGNADLSGPFCFALLLGVILLVSGKWMFDYIYGFGAVGCISMYFLVNLMSKHAVDIYQTISILGYCLLPINLLATIKIVFDLQGDFSSGPFGAITTIACIVWCSHSAALLFTERYDKDQRLLVFYPLMLYYACFALLTIF